MKLTKVCAPRQSIRARVAAYAVFGALLLSGCGKAEKEQEPVVSVQVTPA